MNKTKLLLIEDDDSFSEWIHKYLEECDFELDVYATITDAASNLLFNKYDLVLLDISLSDYEGFELLKFMNKHKMNLPIIVISAYSDKYNKLKSFNLGAVDYMVKPIDLDELAARIWVHLKQTTLLDIEKENKILELNNETIFFNGEQLSLTKIEFEILRYLIENKNQVISRNILADSLSSISSHRSLDYHIRNIRKKIDDDGANPKYIFTEYGKGYKLVI